MRFLPLVKFVFLLVLAVEGFYMSTMKVGIITRGNVVRAALQIKNAKRKIY